MSIHRLVLGALTCLFVWSCGAPPDRTAARSEPVDVAAVERGRQVFQTEACGACHGDQGEGTEVAPPLADLVARWRHEALVAYLVDPGAALESDPRLQGLAEAYELEMPGVATASAEEVADLARYLLAGLE